MAWGSKCVAATLLLITWCAASSALPVGSTISFHNAHNRQAQGGAAAKAPPPLVTPVHISLKTAEGSKHEQGRGQWQEADAERLEDQAQRTMIFKLTGLDGTMPGVELVLRPNTVIVPTGNVPVDVYENGEVTTRSYDSSNAVHGALEDGTYVHGFLHRIAGHAGAPHTQDEFGPFGGDRESDHRHDGTAPYFSGVIHLANGSHISVEPAHLYPQLLAAFNAAATIVTDAGNNSGSASRRQQQSGHSEDDDDAGAGAGAGAGSRSAQAQHTAPLQPTHFATSHDDAHELVNGGGDGGPRLCDDEQYQRLAKKHGLSTTSLDGTETEADAAAATNRKRLWWEQRMGTMGRLHGKHRYERRRRGNEGALNATAAAAAADGDDDDNGVGASDGEFCTGSCTCSVTLIADFKYFHALGSREQDVIASMVAHVTEADTVYRSTVFDGKRGYGLSVGRIVVFKDETDSPVDGSPHGASAFLEAFSSTRWSGTCLAHVFTHREFAEGLLGLAWVGDGRAGICSKSGYNSGFSTTLSFGAKVSQAVSMVVVMHE